MNMNRYETKHKNILREIAPECMVLLKANGKFPLKVAGHVALYGNGARRTLKGGRGSADVNVKSYTTIEQGLLNAGFQITTNDWLDTYENTRKEAQSGFRSWLKKKIADEGMDRLMENLSIVMPEPEYNIPLSVNGDTAIYVLSRLCGEGVDRQNVSGDFLMSQTEIRDILNLEKMYSRFLLVLNTGCVVDLSPVADKVSNILLLSQVGMTIGDSFADVLLGREYPSGKLTATWAAEADYCAIGEFGERDDTRYKEGIYVGYRYFDSVGLEPLFPFGFGLGYTSFSICHGEAVMDGAKITIPVKIKNTGKYRGKEVVQLYVSVPERNLDQPLQMLAAYEKTIELKPGDVTELNLECALESLISTDAVNHLRILERGKYIFRIGNSSRNTKAAAEIELTQDVVIERISAVGGDTDFTAWKPSAEIKILAAEKLFGWQKKTNESDMNVSKFQISASHFSEVKHIEVNIDKDAQAIVEQLSDEQLVYLCTGDFIGEGSKNVIGDSAITVAGAAGETTHRFIEYGIPHMVMADGPSGIRISREYGMDENGYYPIESKEENLMEIENKLELLPDYMIQSLQAMISLDSSKNRNGEIHEQNCTAIPIATALAQSWNCKIAEACAEIVAREMQQFGIQIWLAPAMNIQRNPLCGRTFEYYSEDPLISGTMAATVTNTIQKFPECCVTIKHFICNNQETNRFRSNSLVNERTLRDIYARGFEIVVKESQPFAFMSSYNLLNGTHTSERADLLDILLRKEWGYQGMVMSDFMTGDKSYSDSINKFRKFASAESLKAGNDLMMPGGKAHYENILAALKGENEECRLSRKDVELCAARNIMLAWKLKGKKLTRRK